MNYVDAVQRYREDMIKDIQEMVKIPSKKGEPSKGAPYGKELRKMLDWVLEKAEADGFVTKNYDGYAGRLEYGNGDTIIGVVNHLDVVPEQKEGWKYPPYEGIIDKSVIYGRGSNDNKGPTMAVYYALRCLIDHGYEPKHKLHMIFGCDEEGNMEDMDYYKQHADVLPDYGFVPDCTFPMNYGEHGLLALQLHVPLPEEIQSIKGGDHPHIVCDSIKTQIHHKENIQDMFDFYMDCMELTGMFQAQDDVDVLHIIGKPAHGSRPFQGNNAASALFNFLGNAYKIDTCKQIAHYLSNWQGNPLGIACRDMKFGELSICITQVDTIQQELILTLDIRYPFHLSKEELIKSLQNILSENINHAYITILEDREGCYMEPTSDLVKQLEAIHRKQTGDERTPIKVSPGDTYARKFKNFVAYGPTTIEHLNMQHIGQAHQCNEGMHIDVLMQGCAIYAEALAYLLGGEFKKNDE